MIIYGGYGPSCTGTYCGDAAAYNPSTSTWRLLPAPPISGRYYTQMVWTGSKVVIFGGYSTACSYYCADGAVYDPSSNTWSTLTTASPLDARYEHSGAAFGSYATFYGGYGNYVGSSYYRNTGAWYDPTAGSWKSFAVPTDTIFANTKRAYASMWWAGSKMYVWGGISDTAPYVSTGGIYDSVADSWTAMPAGSLTGRYQATVVWTGTEAIIWGGYGGGYKNDGKVYRP
jgi:N-acetylneuraminic acid mutarotase